MWQVQVASVASRSVMHCLRREKNSKTSLESVSSAVDFPAVLESFGAMGKGLQSIISICAAKSVESHVVQAALGRTWASQSFHQYWTQVIAVAFWRGAYQMDRARQQKLSQVIEAVVPRHRAAVAFCEEPILY